MNSLHCICKDRRRCGSIPEISCLDDALLVMTLFNDVNHGVETFNAD